MVNCMKSALTRFLPIRFSAPIQISRRVLCLLAALSVILALAPQGPAFAAFKTQAKQAILVDLTTNQVLFRKAADEPMAPSSMAKLMTVYLLFDGLKNGQFKLDDELPVSKKAWRMRGSKMFVRVDTNVTIEDLIRGIVVHSGNDASVVVAEGLAGTEEAFAEQMNDKAKQIGLTGSHFTNATGWPDPEQFVTAEDIATLSRRLIEDFPGYYHYFAETSFQYGGLKAQGNRNPLLYKSNLGADGLKTGSTSAGGYGLAASAQRAGRRLILVVNGLKSVRARASESERILNWGFRNFVAMTLFKAGDAVETAEVWLGARPSVPIETTQKVVVSLPRSARNSVTVTAVYEGPVPAPIAKGDRIGVLKVSAPGAAVLEFPLVAGADVAKASFFGRLFANLRRFVEGSLQ